jgi:hypothetical protein
MWVDSRNAKVRAIFSNSEPEIAELAGFDFRGRLT